MKTPRRSGFTLVELITVMAGLHVALGFGALLLIASMRADQMTAAGIERVRRHVELVDAFRADVGSALEVVDSAAGFVTGPECIIFRQSQTDYVIYGWRNGKLDRVVNRASGVEVRPMPLPSSVSQVSFGREGLDKNLITLSVRDTLPSGAVRTMNIAAVMGGDQR